MYFQMLVEKKNFVTILADDVIIYEAIFHFFPKKGKILNFHIF